VSDREVLMLAAFSRLGLVLLLCSTTCAANHLLRDVMMS